MIFTWICDVKLMLCRPPDTPAWFTIPSTPNYKFYNRHWTRDEKLLTLLTGKICWNIVYNYLRNMFVQTMQNVWQFIGGDSSVIVYIKHSKHFTKFTVVVVAVVVVVVVAGVSFVWDEWHEPLQADRFAVFTTIISTMSCSQQAATSHGFATRGRKRGVEAEVPGWRIIERMCFLPSRLEGLGSVVSSPECVCYVACSVLRLLVIPVSYTHLTLPTKRIV